MQYPPNFFEDKKPKSSKNKRLKSSIEELLQRQLDLLKEAYKPRSQNEKEKLQQVFEKANKKDDSMISRKKRYRFERKKRPDFLSQDPTFKLEKEESSERNTQEQFRIVKKKTPNNFIEKEKEPLQNKGVKNNEPEVYNESKEKENENFLVQNLGESNLLQINEKNAQDETPPNIFSQEKQIFAVNSPIEFPEKLQEKSNLDVKNSEDKELSKLEVKKLENNNILSKQEEKKNEEENFGTQINSKKNYSKQTTQVETEKNEKKSNNEFLQSKIKTFDDISKFPVSKVTIENESKQKKETGNETLIMRKKSDIVENKKVSPIEEKNKQIGKSFLIINLICFFRRKEGKQQKRS